MPSSPSAPNAASAYFLASRPKTWIASLSPVLIGTAFAAKETEIQFSIFCLTFLFSLFIQVGTNFANDYFDFKNGADTGLRIGPKRATQEGWISPNTMFYAAMAAFLTAFLTAIPLMVRAGFWWSASIAALSILFGILYTGGPKPLGYLGLGELFVLPFFGPIAVCGTFYLQTGSLAFPVFIGSLGPALISCAILIANNLRDEKSDRSVGKKTLIVRFGHRFGCWEYALCFSGALAVPLTLVLFYSAHWVLALAALPILKLIPLLRKTFPSEDPFQLAALLPATALTLILYTAIFCLALIW